jgi:hypothetical protein
MKLSKSNIKLKKTKKKLKKSKKQSKHKGGSFNKYKTKKVKKGGVIDAARYMVKQKNKTPKKLKSSSKSKHSSPKPVATLFSRPEIKDDYYKKAHKNRKTGKPVNNPGNRSLFDLDNQDILNLIGKETNKIRNKKKLEKQKEELYRKQFWYNNPSCTCDVDGPPGMGTCPECGAYNAY